ncbi:MAG: efflux RND transporter periplasmic adaptor subunit [Bacteroidetes bacterium]|nr:efflux RND transporter periplasmic adaptor subunit [Bacteroidota bacterium]
MKNKIQRKDGMLECWKIGKQPLWYSSNLPIFQSSILFLAIALMFFSCGGSKQDENSEAKQFCITDSLMQSVTFDTVKMQSVTNELILSGKITVNEEKQVRVFPLAGGHVEEVKVSLGDFVQMGQVLAVIRSTDIANYFNEYTSAKSELDIATKNLEVTEDMYKNGLSSEKEHITAQEEFTKAQSAYNKASEVLKIYGNATKEDAITGSGYVIKSPITGFIVEKNINSGMELRTDDAANLFTVSDLKEVWAIANVYESDIAKVQLGYDADITTMSYGDKKFTGKIDKISNIMNPETKVLNVKVRLQNTDYLLKPGMFARITLHYPEKEKMLSVPAASVIFDDNKNYVVRYKGKCDVKMMPVTVCKSLDGKSCIQGEGLKENDVVLTKGGLYVFTALKKQ